MNEYRLPKVVVDNGAATTGINSSPPKEDIVLCKIYRKAVSLKALEQRVAMEELARASASATPSAATSDYMHEEGGGGDHRAPDDAASPIFGDTIDRLIAVHNRHFRVVFFCCLIAP